MKVSAPANDGVAEHWRAAKHYARGPPSSPFVLKFGLFVVVDNLDVFWCLLRVILLQ